MAFDAASDYVFITLQDSNEVMAPINPTPKRNRHHAQVGPTPVGIKATPDNRHLLATSAAAKATLEVIDWKTQKTVKKVPTDTTAAKSPPAWRWTLLLASNRSVSGGSISLLDTQTMTVVEKYERPAGLHDMEVRADGKELWATARFARRVQVVDLTTKTLENLYSRRQPATRGVLP